MPSKAKSFATMETDSLECRVLRHVFEHKITFVNKDRTLELVFECHRCPVTRIDTWSMDGRRKRAEVIKRSYKYPNGYLIQDPTSWGGRKVFNENVRYELGTRYMGKGG